jgi:hypothetical protein
MNGALAAALGSCEFECEDHGIMRKVVGLGKASKGRSQGIIMERKVVKLRYKGSREPLSKFKSEILKMTRLSITSYGDFDFQDEKNGIMVDSNPSISGPPTPSSQLPELHGLLCSLFHC